jgi:hypothetical protein
MLERKDRLGVAFAAVALLVAISASLAIAAETTRDEYKAAVEPICKANTKANERILKGVRSEVKKGELKPAARQFAAAGRALKKTRGELAAVPRPVADKARLSKWLGYIKAEVGLFETTARELKAGNQIAAERTAVLLTREAEQANNEVVGFEFDYCHGEPSKFT